MKAVILAAGKGTRMRGLCEKRPKPLLPLANRPALQLTISRLKEAGVSDMLVVVGHQQDKIKQSHGYGTSSGVKLYYVVQEALNGTGGAAMLAEGFVEGEPFFLVFGDVIAHTENYVRAARLLKSGAGAVVSTFDLGRPVKIGAVFAQDGRVVKIVERPSPREHSSLVSAGIFIFPPEIFEATRNLPPAPTGEHELTGGIQALVENGMEVAAMPVSGFWANLTDPVALLQANAAVQRELAERREPLVQASAKVSPRATVDEFAAVAADARIEEGAVIGPNVSIGARSVIGSGARLEGCILIDKVAVGAGAVVENAVIDAGAEVPPGAVIRSPSSSACVIWKTMYACETQTEAAAKAKGQ